MIYDLNTLQVNDPDKLYDACIVGAGVAGITLATQLSKRGHKILLLEAGDKQYEEASQNLYKGESIGRNYHELNQSRLRFLGGTSNHWEGKCRPLDSLDFKARNHIQDSGWPIDKTDLNPYSERACEILEIENEFLTQPVTSSAKMFNKITFQWSTPVRFGEKYHNALKSDSNIDLFLNANLVNMNLSDKSNHVKEVFCANYTAPEKRFIFLSKVFVIAMGAIENPRMLLNFRDQLPKGIGNNNDLVGRYFMDHIAVMGGYYVTDKNKGPFNQSEFFFAASEALTNNLEISNVRLQIGPIVAPGPDMYTKIKQRFICSEEIVYDFISNFKDIWCPTPVYIGGYLHVVSEQSPNPDSRVSLSSEKDQFGLQRTKLDWQFTDLDRHTIKQIATSFGVYMADREFGNVKLMDWMLDDKKPVPSVGEDEWHGAGWHHMGTTRMAESADKGVVDKNCRVFEIDNLYMAGSSVFPTGGHANPTFTIVQLTLRLCDHLDSILKS